MDELTTCQVCHEEKPASIEHFPPDSVVCRRCIYGDAPRRHTTRVFSDEEVMHYRQALADKDISIPAIAAEKGVSYKAAWGMALGATYADLPVPEGLEPSGRRGAAGRLSDDEVLRLRRAYIAREVRVQDILDETGMHPTSIYSMLHGGTYKHVGEAVPKGTKSRRGAFSDEQVAYYRQAVANGEIRALTISRETKVNLTAIYSMLHGTTYAHLPGAVPKSKGRGKDRTWTDDQVRYYRRAVANGDMTIGAVGRESMVADSVARSMINGDTYAEVTDDGDEETTC